MGRNRMKALAINTVGIIVITVVSIVLVFQFVKGNLANMLFSMYCKLSSLFSFTPPECKKEEIIKEVYIAETSNYGFSKELLKYILLCWKNYRNSNNFVTCYKVRITKLPVENVTEENVTKVLKKEYGCEEFQNFDYECGAMDNLVWLVDGDVILIDENVLKEAINYASVPKTLLESPISFQYFLTKKSELITLLKEVYPQTICNVLGCDWYYDPKALQVYFNFTNEIIKYDIPLILSYLERNGNVFSPIRSQTILFIKYNPKRNCVEVVG